MKTMKRWRYDEVKGARVSVVTRPVSRQSEIRPRLNFCRRKNLSGHHLAVSQACETSIRRSNLTLSTYRNKKKPATKQVSFYFAERARFELARPVRVRRFSKPLISATHPSLHIFTLFKWSPLTRFDGFAARRFSYRVDSRESSFSLVHLIHLSIYTIRETIYPILRI